MCAASEICGAFKVSGGDKEKGGRVLKPTEVTSSPRREKSAVCIHLQYGNIDEQYKGDLFTVYHWKATTR